MVSVVCVFYLLCPVDIYCYTEVLSHFSVVGGIMGLYIGCLCVCFSKCFNIIRYVVPMKVCIGILFYGGMLSCMVVCR